MCALSAGANFLIADERTAVQQVERLPFGQIEIDVDECNLADDAAGLQRKPGARSHQSAAADDTDFHDCIPD